MVRKIFIIFFVLALNLLFINIVSATTFSIQTLKDHRISFILRESGKLQTLDSFHQDTGNGNVTISPTSEVSLYDIILILKKDGNEIINKKFEEVKSGEEVIITFRPGDVKLQYASEIEQPVVNVTANETIASNESEEIAATTNETNNNEQVNNTDTNAAEAIEEDDQINVSSNESNEKIVKNKTSKSATGLISLNNIPIKSDQLVKIVFGIIIISVIIFIIVFVVKKTKKSSFSDFKTKSMSEFLKSKDSSSKRIDELEKRLIETKRDLDDIRNKDRKIKELKDEIHKLERDY